VKELNVKENLSKARVLNVNGLENNEIAYNPAVIIDEINGKRETILALRVEHKNSYWLSDIYNPHIRFFKYDGNVLNPLIDAPEFEMHEDAFATWYMDGNKKRILFGAVFVDRTNRNNPQVTTRFYSADNVLNLNPKQEPIAVIHDMKDIRLVQDPNDGKFFVLTRPTKGEEVGEGRIGFMTINGLNDLTDENVNQAKLLPISEIGMEDKIGSNEVHLINTDDNPRLLVYGHTARADGPDWEKDTLHYRAMRFIFDPSDPFCQPIIPEIFLSTDMVDGHVSGKYPRTTDVVFTGGKGIQFDEKLTPSLVFYGIGDNSVAVGQEPIFSQLEL
jgi:hypothetical protein